MVAERHPEHRRRRLVLLGSRHRRIRRQDLGRSARHDSGPATLDRSMTDWGAAAADVAAIVAARHADPFAVLGPHATDAGLVVRAFVPDAVSLWLLAEDGARPVRFR